MSLKRSEITVGVTGLKHIESPQAGFGIAKSLKEAGYKVIGIDDSPLVSAVVSNDFDKVYRLRSLVTEDKKQFLREVKNIIERDKLKVIIPGFDREIFFFHAIKDELESLGIKILLPSIKSLKMTSKPFLYNLNDKGLLVPKTIRIKTAKDVENAAEELGFPVVCKGLLKDVYMAESLTEAKLYFNIVRERWGGGKGSVLFQKFIAGEPVCVIGLADDKSRLVRALVMKKLGTDAKGSTWSGFSLYDKRLLETAKRFVKETKWVGAFELEFLRTYDGKKDYLFEANPRFPAWLYFVTALGHNLPEINVKILLGERVKPDFSYDADKAFIRSAREEVVPLGLFVKLKKEGFIDSPLL